jgi:hypothetical protein
MKKLFILLAIVLIGMSASAQKRERGFTTDTVQGAETVYFTFAGKIEKYNGVVAFSGTKTDVADSLNLFRIQGANWSDFRDATNLTGDGALVNTTTDGGFNLFITPPTYMYYRLAATCAAGDTVIITTPKLTYRETE